MLLVGFCMTLQACHSCKPADSASITAPPASPAKQPFSNIEPAVYQAYLVILTMGTEEQTFVARKNDKYRTDLFQNGQRTMSEIIAGSRYVLDHRQQTYYEEPAGAVVSNFVSPAESFFRGKKFATFDEIGSDGKTARYRVKQEGVHDTVTLTVDRATNMIIAQEFTADDGSVTVKYELRDLKLEVGDDVFQIPSGYRKMSPPVVQ